MPSTMRSIVKSVLEYIKEHNLQPTPETYREIFCQKAKEFGFKVTECDRLSSLAQKLSTDEQIELSKMDIGDVDSLFDFVVTKLRQREQDMLSSGGMILSDITLEKIASLMLASLIPAYSNKNFDESVQDLQDEINKNPNLIRDEQFQENIKYLIEKRIDLDQQAITDKTSKMTTLINKMSTFIEDTVENNQVSASNLNSINSELQQITFDDFDKSTFENFKQNMVVISNKMKDEVNKLSAKLSSEKNEVSILKEKIKALESNLKVAQNESRTDFLTGVLTRRSMDMELKLLDKEYEKNNIDYTLIFIDLDHFKVVNDKYGHDAGDVILSTFAKLLLRLAPKKSIVGRYGGEEFVVVIPGMSVADARGYLTLVNDFVHKSKFVYNDLSIKVTFSAGIARRKTNNSLEDTIKEADKFLYKAKHLGRDRIESN